MCNARTADKTEGAWIIHRDIKPENIMVRADGVVKVLDFGIAKLSEDIGEPGERPFEHATVALAPEPDASMYTLPGTILGTASYMSPEQARGEPLDGRTDLFSLGVVLYEMVTGRRLPPLPPGDDREPLPATDRFDAAPRELERIIRKLLRKNRNERHASAGELLDELRAFQRQLTSRQSRRLARISLLALLSLVTLVGLAAAISRRDVWDEQILRDGHTAAVRQAVFSPDGRLLVSVGEDNQIIVWDFARRQRVRALRDHRGWVTSAAFSPDGTRFATASLDRTVIVWDSVRLEKIQALRSSNPLEGVAFSQVTRGARSGSGGCPVRAPSPEARSLRIL